MFTVVVAAMGREVLAVDADPQNLALIRKSLDLQKTRARVRLFSNAVSDEYTVLYPFSPDRTNQGGTVMKTLQQLQREQLQSDIVS